MTQEVTETKQWFGFNHHKNPYKTSKDIWMTLSQYLVTLLIRVCYIKLMLMVYW